jgi:hypothetical protein
MSFELPMMQPQHAANGAVHTVFCRRPWKRQPFPPAKSPLAEMRI